MKYRLSELIDALTAKRDAPIHEFSGINLGQGAVFIRVLKKGKNGERDQIVYVRQDITISDMGAFFNIDIEV